MREGAHGAAEADHCSAGGSYLSEEVKNRKGAGEGTAQSDSRPGTDQIVNDRLVRVMGQANERLDLYTGLPPWY